MKQQQVHRLWSVPKGMFLVLVLLQGTLAFPTEQTQVDQSLPIEQTQMDLSPHVEQKQIGVVFPSVKGGVSFDDHPFPQCPLVHVNQSESMPYVPVEDSLTLSIRPSTSRMYMRIMIDDVLYKVNVMGTMLELFKCENDHDSCTTLDQGGSKSSDLLNPGQWNPVTVSVNQNKLQVDVNMKENVMSKMMPTMGSEAHHIKVAIVADDPKTAMKGAEDYKVDVNIECDVTETTSTKEDTTTMQLSPAPYSNCSLFQVKMNQPLPYVTIENSLTLSVFPSESLLYMWILVEDVLYKATVERMQLKLLKCEDDGSSCEILEESGSKSADLLYPNKWNNVVISLENNEITVDVNMQSKVMAMAMPGDGKEGTQTGQISIVLSDPSITKQQDTDYTVDVNVMCNDTYHPFINMTSFTYATERSTINPFVTPNPIVETSTKNPPAEPSNQVGIIVGVLLALLVVAIIVAVVLNSYKKKRSAQINQHTPLKDQQQTTY